MNIRLVFAALAAVGAVWFAPLLMRFGLPASLGFGLAIVNGFLGGALITYVIRQQRKRWRERLYAEAHDAVRRERRGAVQRRMSAAA